MRIIDNIRPDRQTVMFSATFPRQMEALARRILKKPIEVQVGGRSVVCKDVEQHVAVLEEDAKFFKLLELLGHYQVNIFHYVRCFTRLHTSFVLHPTGTRKHNRFCRQTRECRYLVKGSNESVIHLHEFTWRH